MDSLPGRPLRPINTLLTTASPRLVSARLRSLPWLAGWLPPLGWLGTARHNARTHHSQATLYSPHPTPSIDRTGAHYTSIHHITTARHITPEDNTGEHDTAPYYTACTPHLKYTPLEHTTHHHTSLYHITTRHHSTSYHKTTSHTALRSKEQHYSTPHYTTDSTRHHITTAH